jgi:iron complex transport system ATP-binding protein
MIVLRHISASYHDKKVLHDISLQISAGEFTFILGPNGAGKSTLLKTLNGIKSIDSGDIQVYEKSVSAWDEKALAQHISFIPQHYHTVFDFTVLQMILMARYPWLDFFGRYSSRDYDIVEKYINDLDLTLFQQRSFLQLSGGERQRVLIARALVQDTPYILMDESLSSLDINHQIEILGMLQRINHFERKTIIMVSHNLNLASEFAKRIIFIKDGEVLADGNAQDVFCEKTLSDTFSMDVSVIKNPYTDKYNIVYRG